MNLTEALSEGLQVTVIGLVIVFSILVILMLVMMAMKVIFYREGKKSEVQAPPVSQNAVREPEQNIDEAELIAVLTAAVAASLNTSTYNLNIKSYRRIGNSAPGWNQAGLRDVIDARF